MTIEEFRTAIMAKLNIPEPKHYKTGGQRDPYPYRLGSKEQVKVTDDTVELIKVLYGQGMNKSEIARQMWMDNSAVGRIINGKRHCS